MKAIRTFNSMKYMLKNITPSWKRDKHPLALVKTPV